MKPIIEVNNISKIFYKEVKKINQNHIKNANEFWALKDINFTLNKGESVGLLGRNGSGKSTLLKIIAGIINPTVGSVTVRGSISGIFELSAGFYPDLSGRKNIFFYGSIIGLKQKYLKKIYDEIVAFSGLENFIDEPVRTYSSGMRVRLAFSISMFVKPDILLIDEALAVGDAAFKNKCSLKIQEHIDQGGSLILVNHNTTAISELCTKAIILEHGKIIHNGDVDTTVSKYSSLIHKNKIEKILSYKNGKYFNIVSAKIQNKYRNAQYEFSIDDKILIELILNVEKENYDTHKICFEVYSVDDLLIFSTNHNFKIREETFSEGIYTIVCEIPENLLNTGKYYVSVRSESDNSLNPYINFNKKKVVKFSLNTKNKINLENKQPLIVPNLRTYDYNIKSSENEYKNAIKDNDTIFLVYTMAKVGTTSISKALKKQLPNAYIFHIHFLDNFWFDFIPERMYLNVDVRNEALKILKKHPEKKIKVITLVRDPIARKISDFFQVGNLHFGNIKEKMNVQDYIHELNNYHYVPSLLWFDIEFRNFLGFDIYQHAFDKEAGYQKYIHNNIEILCIKLEQLNDITPTILNKFVGTELNLEILNKSSSKPNAELYKELKENLKLNKNTIKKIYNSRLVKHFYTTKEINKFIKQWT